MLQQTYHSKNSFVSSSYGECSAGQTMQCDQVEEDSEEEGEMFSEEEMNDDQEDVQSLGPEEEAKVCNDDD